MSVFARAYNCAQGLTGHVWGSRFYSRILESFWEYLMVFDYIEENPVEAGQAANTLDWRYGGLWHHRIGCRAIMERIAEYVALAFPAHMLLRLPGR